MIKDIWFHNAARFVFMKMQQYTLGMGKTFQWRRHTWNTKNAKGWLQSVNVKDWEETYMKKELKWSASRIKTEGTKNVEKYYAKN